MTDIDNFMAMIPSEDSPVVVDTPSEESVETETPSESPAENEPTEEAPSPDGAVNSQDEQNVPFHKHPRWVEREKSWKERFSSQESQISQLRAELETRLSNIQNQSTAPNEIPDEFVKLYGSDPEAFKLWRKSQEDFASRIKAEIRQEDEQRQLRERENLSAGERYVEDSLQSLEDDGKVFDRNELMKFMVDFKESYGVLPSDDQDNIDFQKGYDLMMTMRATQGVAAKEKSVARKNLASFSSESTGGEAQTKDYLTSNDLKNMDWDSLV